jgi:hypothetical protein
MSDTPDYTDAHDEAMPAEYDFSERIGMRGKYYQQLRDGYTIKIHRADGTTLVQQITRPEGTVTLDPDVQDYFPDSEAVNTALRTLIQLVKPKKKKRSASAASPKAQSS